MDDAQKLGRRFTFAKVYLETATKLFLEDNIAAAMILVGTADRLLGQGQPKNALSVIRDTVKRDFSAYSLNENLTVADADESKLTGFLNEHFDACRHRPEDLPLNRQEFKDSTILMFARALKNYKAWQGEITPLIKQGMDLVDAHLNTEEEIL